MVKTYSACNTH